MLHVNEPLKILVAEDEPEVRSYLEVALRTLGYAVDLVDDGEEALLALRENGGQYCLLLLDLMLPRKNGIETLRELRRFDTGLPVIVLSSASSPLNIVGAIKSGANDFLAKPVGHEELDRTIQKALRICEDPPARPAAESVPQQEAWRALSSWTKKLDLFLDQVGSSDVPVLLQGETGVGKEVLARQMHARSPRAHKPFLKLNCAALPSELIESELFGYERGAFTGAFRSNPGKFEMADTGTIFLDEIGDMDFKLQAKLLQVLQDGEFLRLGGKAACRVDVRVIAATHVDLEEAVAQGRFREDLYYRLNIIRIEIPPLRERKDEILPLASFFIERHTRPGDARAEITPRLRQALMSHSWPGNIRELENVMRKLIVIGRPDMIAEELRPARVTHLGGSSRAAGADKRPPDADQTGAGEKPFPAFEVERRIAIAQPRALSGVSAARGEGLGAEEPATILRKVDQARKQAEMDAILAALNTTLWNRKQAAVLLHVEYKALLYKMKKLGIGESPLEATAS
jgi:DNA-binding NtrC family response regulator